MKLTDGERRSLSVISEKLGRKVFDEIASIVKPKTIVTWRRRLVARKLDGSESRECAGVPRVAPEVEGLLVSFAKESRDRGYDRIVGTLANVGHKLSDRTVGNILTPHEITPATERSKTTTWKEFIRSHMAVFLGRD